MNVIFCEKRRGEREKKREKEREKKERKDLEEAYPAEQHLSRNVYTFLSILLCASQGVIPRSIQVGLIC